MGSRETRDLIKKKKKTTTEGKHLSQIENYEKVKVVNKVEEENKKGNPIVEKRKKKKTGTVDTGKAIEIAIADNSNKMLGEKKKKSKKNKRERDEQIALVDHHGDNAEEDNSNKMMVEMKKKLKKNKRESDEQIVRVGHHGDDAEEDNSNKIMGEKNKKKAKKNKREKDEKIVRVEHHGDDAEEGNSKRAKKKKKNHHATNENGTFSDKSDKVEQDEVYHISSVDEDGSRGMKKWITKYHQTRPGLTVLQQQIDEFITAHEEKLEQERKDREARDEAEGWTVVSHLKGRKKTTDSESGITMGAVSLAAVSEFREEKEKKMMKKKQTEALPDFYRFQRKEAQMNEILSLRSKFEQDKKKIQQLRAARKFKPY